MLRQPSSIINTHIQRKQSVTNEINELTVITRISANKDFTEHSSLYLSLIIYASRNIPILPAKNCHGASFNRVNSKEFHNIFGIKMKNDKKRVVHLARVHALHKQKTDVDR